MPRHIIVYSTPACSYCHMVKDYLKEKGLEFIDKDVSKDESASQEMIDKSGQMGVPVIDVDGQIMIGFDKNQLTNLLK